MQTYNPNYSRFHLVGDPSPLSRACIYINKRIDTNTWSVEAAETDYCSIGIEVKNGAGAATTIRIHNVYHPCPISTTSMDGSSTLPRIAEVLGQGGPHLLLGDFNLHHPYWGGSRCFSRHAMSDTLVDIVTQAQMDMFTEPGTVTREVGEQKTTIDLTFGQQWLTERLVKCQVREDLHQGSDHLPVETIISRETPARTQPERKLWKRMDQDALRKGLRQYLPGQRQLQDSHEVAQYARDLTGGIQGAIDRAVPWARPSPRAKDHWTQECSDAVAHARSCRAEWKRQGTPDAKKRMYKATDKKGKVIQKAKTAFFRAQMHRASDDPSAIWKLAKGATTRNTRPRELPQFPPMKRTQGEGVATAFQEKAEILAGKFFPLLPTADLDDLIGVEYPEPLELAERIEPGEIETAIRRTGPDKAPGLSQITNRILKVGIEELLPSLTCLFNACITHAYHPRTFKEANTAVLRKPNKSDYTEPKSYRPIALLDTVGKALESIMARRISNLLEKYDLLPPTQMGSRHSRSAVSALELLTEQVHTVWGCGTEFVVSMLSLDMTGAFDHVSHPRLLHILRMNRLPDRIVKWVASFLRDWRTSLSFGGQTSAVEEAT